jgi:Tol biopolymer transport system component
MRANGSHADVLTHGHWVDGAPKFSPDGQRIVFDSDRGGLESALWVMKSDGSRMHRLTPPRLDAFWPDWSPNQTHITFSTNCCRQVGEKLWTMRADGSHAHAITAVGKDHNAAFGAYAPNGRRIALVSDVRYPHRCCNDLYVMNADGSDMHTVLTNRPTVLFSDWGRHEAGLVDEVHEAPVPTDARQIGSHRAVRARGDRRRFEWTCPSAADPR